jgi:hypothetical protein
LNIGTRSKKSSENLSLTEGRFVTGRPKSGIGSDRRNEPEDAFLKGEGNDDNETC